MAETSDTSESDIPSTYSEDLLSKIQLTQTVPTSEFKSQLSQKIKSIIGEVGIPLEKLEGNSSSVSNKRFAVALSLSQSTLSTKSQLIEELGNYLVDSRLPAEALNFIVESQNSIESGPAGTGTGTGGGADKNEAEGITRNKNLAILNITKKLFELWIGSNCLAEAFVRFSTSGASSAETANFSRNLFSIPTNFHVSRQEFPTFIFEQLLLAVSTLSKSIRLNQNAQEQVRTQFISSTLDRLFLRFHTDQEHFYPYFEIQDNMQDEIDAASLNDLILNDPFIKFVISAAQLISEDFIARRLLGKVLLGLGQNQVNKIARTVILTQAYCGCAATKLFHPPDDFLFLKNETWKHVLLFSVPLKTRVSNFPFFTAWSNFVLYATENRGGDSTDVFQIWKELCSNWSEVINNSYADSKTTVSSTCALVCLCKAIKSSDQLQSFLATNALSSSAVVPIFQGVQKCLGSTNPEKQACGMAIGQIIADLILQESEVGPTTMPPPQPQANKNPAEMLADSLSTDREGAAATSLKFESTNPLFAQFVNFYEKKDENEIGIGATIQVINKNSPLKKITPRNLCNGLMTVLDSDDDEEAPDIKPVDEDDIKEESSSGPAFKPYDMSDDTPVCETLLNIGNTDKKIPVYFSDICEILMESQGSKDDSTVECLKQIAIMKIPVLLTHKIPMDSTTGKDLTRALIELDNGSLLEIPAICGLYEIGSLYPIEVFQTVGQLAFDKEHYTAGHRMVILARLTEVIQLLSKQKCFWCFSEKTGKLDKLLETVHPPFIRDYMLKKRGQRKCQSCVRVDGGKIKPKSPAVAVARPASKETQNSSNTSTSKESNIANASESSGLSAKTESGLVAASNNNTNLELPWREVIERRLAAKTRRFGSAKVASVESVDVYSAKLVPIIWASIANKLMDEINLRTFLNSEHADCFSFAMFTAQAFRALGMIVLGTSGIYCPHLRNIAAQSVDLVSVYSRHSDAQVRRSVLSLLATIITSSESKQFIMEIFLNSSRNLFDELKLIYENDTDGENRHLFANLMQLATASAMVQMGSILK